MKCCVCGEESCAFNTTSVDGLTNEGTKDKVTFYYCREHIKSFLGKDEGYIIEA